jgi:aspartate/methionine/tyrosine aminotransferase
MTDEPVLGLQPFHAMEILARANALEAEGRDICHLELGEPAMPPAPGVVEAARAVLDHPQRYTNSKGRIELRQGLSRYYSERHRADVDPDNIIVTVGSSAAIQLAFLAAFERGACIAVTRPGYPAYLNMLQALGFTPVEIALSARDGWHLSAYGIEAAHRRLKFDGLLFASPANPTGAVADGHALQSICETCEQLGVRLISDEIYHGLSHVGPSVSAVEFGTGAIAVNSFSKYHCMTGWRVGWMVLPDPLVRRAEMLQQNFFISAPTLSQIAAEAALGEFEYAEGQRAHYAANRDVLIGGLRDLGLSVGGSEGGFYAYADVSGITDDSMQFCLDLLEAEGVAAVPGIDFDRQDGQKYVRFSYAGATGAMHEALKRLRRLLADAS